MKRKYGLILGIIPLLTLGVAACDDGGADSTNPTTASGGGDTAMTASGTGDDDDDASTGATATGTTGDDDDAATTFVMGNDIMDVASCDVWGQDCPEGEKCAPYNSGGGTWDAVKCVVVAEDAKEVGDACTSEAGNTGNDDCIEGAICDGLNEDNQGVCKSLCAGSPEATICPNGAACSINNEGILNLCELPCDPLLTECSEEEVCIEVPGGQAFTCAPGIADAAVGEACNYTNSCAPGGWCTFGFPDAVPSCDGDQCCSAYCSLTGDGSECLDGQECLAWFDSDVPGLEHVGRCTVPN